MHFLMIHKPRSNSRIKAFVHYFGMKHQLTFFTDDCQAKSWTAESCLSEMIFSYALQGKAMSIKRNTENPRIIILEHSAVPCTPCSSLCPDFAGILHRENAIPVLHNPYSLRTY